MNGTSPRTLVYYLAAVMGWLLLNDLWTQYRAIQPVPYSEFVSQLKAGNVESLTVSANSVQGQLKNALPDGRKQFVTTRVDSDLARDLGQYDVKFSGMAENTWLRDMLGWIVPALLFVAVWLAALRYLQSKAGMGGMGAGFLPLGKSRAKVYVETDTKVSFDDVAGVDEAKEELREVVGFLKDPTRYSRLGARIPKGVLLVGPPGTGKTLLARAVAGEAGVPFFSMNGSEFVEMFVGLGAARVRDLFEQAAQKAPAIIFIDEIDALGRARGAFGIGGHDEKEQTLNQLLAELDGFDARSGLELDQVAALTPGFSGADLANLANEAALQATRREHAAVTLDDFTAAIERIVAGLEKRNRLLNPRERQVVAHHEMGHALVALSLPGQDPVQKISIIPRGIGTLGYTLQRPTEDRYLMTRHELENKMAVLLGGRAAEHLVFNELSTGAADDLAKVSEIARSIVVRYGMDEGLGAVVYETDRPRLLEVESLAPPQRNYSEQTAREIDLATRRLVDAAFERSLGVLTRLREQLDRGAAQLLARETLTDQDLKALLKPVAESATAAPAS